MTGLREKTLRDYVAAGCTFSFVPLRGDVPALDKGYPRYLICALRTYVPSPRGCTRGTIKEKSCLRWQKLEFAVCHLRGTDRVRYLEVEIKRIIPCSRERTWTSLVWDGWNCGNWEWMGGKRVGSRWLDAIERQRIKGTVPSHRVARQGTFCQRTTGQKERSHRVPKGGTNFRDGGHESRDPDPSLPRSCPLISWLIYIAACLHAAAPAERFPELFTGQLVNFVPLLFISAVIDSTIHISFSLCLSPSLRPPLARLLAPAPSFCHPCAVNVLSAGEKIYHLAPEFGNKSFCSSRDRPE